jgi:hypothetical protein
MATTEPTKAERFVVLLGFVEAGKSTYLAATYHIANSTKVPGSLQISASEKDLEYIETLHEQWLRCRPLARTSGQSPQVVTLNLTKSDLPVGLLRIPDPSGEALINSLGDRRWDFDFDAFIRAATGLMLFVNPSRIIEPVTWVEAVAWAAQVEGDGGTETDGEALIKKPWSITEASTGALLVDLLEAALSRNPRRPIPVAMIVSAWDLIDDGDPHAWIDQHLPLLSQYFQNNPALVTVRCFGISAQGGPLPEQEDQLQAVDEPADRVRIVGSEGDHRDLTAPLKWLLGI